MARLIDFIIPTPGNNYRAHLISNWALLTYLFFLVVVNVFFTAGKPLKVFALVDERSIVQMHNIERGRHGLANLTINTKLEKSALEKAKAMLESDCWAHFCPNGKSPWDFFSNANYDYSFAGENLAEGFSSNEAVISAWMNSKTHRENILKSEFTEIGVAIVSGRYQGAGQNTLIVVHFGRPKVQPKQVSPIISSPQEGQVLNSVLPEITGSFDKPVLLEIDGNVSGQIPSVGGIFTYQPESQLSYGPKTISAIDSSNANNKSTPVKFELRPVSEAQPSIVEQLKQLAPVQILSLGLVLSLIALFSIDFVVIKRLNMKYNLKLRTNAEMHLASLVLLVIMGLMGNIHTNI